MALMHLDNIHVGERIRPLDEAKVSELVESIRALGLLNPITVSDEGLLVAGNHRLEACRRLAAEDEAYAIVPVSYFEQPELARQAEIAENFVRNDLSLLERAEHLALYLESLERQLPAEEQARLLGMSRKSFFNYRRIVREIAPELRARIKALDHELRHSTRQLLELAAMPARQQQAFVAALENAQGQPAGEAESPSESQAARTPGPSGPRKTLTVSLSPDLQGRLRARAEAHGLKQGEFTRRLLAQALAALEQGQLQLEDEQD